MNTLLNPLFGLVTFLLFQNPPADDGIAYTPQDAGPGWLLYGAVVLVLAALVFVLIKVFRGLQKSRSREDSKEETDSPSAPER